jgi:hypothetical protein
MSKGSPKPAAQPFEHLVARNEFNFSSLDLSGSLLDFDSPRLLDAGVGWAVKRFDKGESQLRPFSLRELSHLFLEFGKNVRHTPPRPFVSRSTIRSGHAPWGGVAATVSTLTPSISRPHAVACLPRLGCRQSVRNRNLEGRKVKMVA